MNKRTITIIILSIVVILLLAGIFYFFFFFKFPGSIIPKVIKTPVAQTEVTKESEFPVTSTPIIKQAETPKTTTAKPATSEEVEKLTLVKIASSFAERLGSYSNQDNYANVTNLKILMTLSMQKWADSYVASAKKANPDTNIYHGLTTHAMTTEVKNFDSVKGSADILVHTQKIVSDEAAADSAPYTEDLMVTFIKEGAQWKVDNAKWMNKK